LVDLGVGLFLFSVGTLEFLLFLPLSRVKGNLIAIE
jgi:hypothetical protein